MRVSTDTKRQFSDINLKLNALNSQLPQGAGPISFQSDFGDTAALMLTVASPKADDIEIAARANSVEAAIRKARVAKQQNREGQRITVVDSFPQSISAKEVLDTGYLFQAGSAERWNYSRLGNHSGEWIHRSRWSFRCR